MRKPAHHQTARWIGRPTSQSMLPSSHKNAPRAITAVCSVRCRHKIQPNNRASPRLPKVISKIPPRPPKPSHNNKPPNPDSSAGANAHRCRSATARSRQINVPKKPLIISGPCSAGRVSRSGGHAQPMRKRPAHMPATNASIAKNKRGKRAFIRYLSPIISGYRI